MSAPTKPSRAMGVRAFRHPKLRAGIEGNRKQVLAKVHELSVPVLVSANSLWDDKRQTFRTTWRALEGLDVALDSGGFVAMRMFGGYRFSVDQYTSLAAQMRPTWWAQMDFCCEPEVAGRSGEVARRIDLTARHLQQCQSAARERGIIAPLAVLQGWKPDDYCKGPIFDQDYDWPELVGVGSVCRRKLHGADGLLAVVAALDKALPPHVRLHLFGVKGAALRYLRDHPRFESMDSMAWAMAARWESRRTGAPCDGAMRASFLEEWLRAQSATMKGPQLPLL